MGDILSCKTDAGVKAKERILCIDDDPETCALLSDLLGAAGYDVVAVYDAEDGLRNARQGGFFAIVLDTWIPGTGGIEICRSIKSFDTGTPIVFLSAATESGESDEAIAAGAEAYFAKPLGVLDLRAYLHGLARNTGGGAGMAARP